AVVGRPLEDTQGLVAAIQLVREDLGELARKRRMLLLVALDLDQDGQVLRRRSEIADLHAELVETRNGVEVLLVERVHRLERGDRALRIVELPLEEVREASRKADALLVVHGQRGQSLQGAGEAREIGALLLERCDALERRAMVRV